MLSSTACSCDFDKLGISHAFIISRPHFEFYAYALLCLLNFHAQSNYASHYVLYLVQDDYFELNGPLKKIDSYRSSSSELAFSSGVSSAAGSRTRSIEEFKLESVKSYLTSQDEEDYFDYIKPVRAYSMGSRPPPKDGGYKSLKSLRALNATGDRQLQCTSTAMCDPQSRVRSLSMGSQNARVRSSNFRNK